MLLRNSVTTESLAWYLSRYSIGIKARSIALAPRVGFDPLGDFAKQPIDRAVAGDDRAVGVVTGRVFDYLESARGDHLPFLALTSCARNESLTRLGLEKNSCCHWRISLSKRKSSRTAAAACATVLQQLVFSAA